MRGRTELILCRTFVVGVYMVLSQMLNLPSRRTVTLSIWLNYARDIYAKYILQAYRTCFKTESYQVIPNTEHPLMNFFSFVVSGTAEDIDRWCVPEWLLRPLLNVVPQVLNRKRYTTLPARSLRIWQNLRSHPSVFEDVHVPKESKQKYMCSTSAVLTRRLMSIVYDEQQVLASTND